MSVITISYRLLEISFFFSGRNETMSCRQTSRNDISVYKIVILKTIFHLAPEVNIHVYLNFDNCFKARLNVVSRAIIYKILCL